MGAAAAVGGRPLDAGRSWSICRERLANPDRPLLAVVGGAKVSSKIDLLQTLVTKVETLVIGGAMANTFLAAQGISVGKPLHEPDLLETARKVIHMANESGAAILLPVDVVVAKGIRPGAAHPHRPGGGNRGRTRWPWMWGPETIKGLRRPPGRDQDPGLERAPGPSKPSASTPETVAAARAVAAATRAGHLLSVAGGGDTVAALAHSGVENDFSLRLNCRRSLPGMAGRKRVAGRGSAQGLTGESL